MKIPAWFRLGMCIWLIIGVPAFVVGQGFRGSFGLLPDPPPFLAYPYEDASLLANGSWLLAVALIYAPLILVPLLLLQRRRLRKKSNVED